MPSLTFPQLSVILRYDAFLSPKMSLASGGGKRHASAGRIERMCLDHFSLGNLVASCGAKFFRNEFPNTRNTRRFCCKNGDVILKSLSFQILITNFEITICREANCNFEFRNDIAALFIGDYPPFPVDLQLRPRAVAAAAPPPRSH